MNVSHIDQLWKKSGLVGSPDPSLYLDTVTVTDFAQVYKRRTYALMEVRRNAKLLDVGCGTGEDVLALGRLVGPGGKVTGVDRNPAMVAEGWKRANSTGLPVVFQLEDSHRLTFPDDTFDGVRCDRALQHMDAPGQAIAEIVRVTRPGGKVVLSEPDWETLVIDTGKRDVTRRVVNYMSDLAVKHGWVGRQLYAFCKDQPLNDVKVSAFPFIITDYTTADRIWGLQRHASQAKDLGFLTEAELADWNDELKQLDNAGRFFSATVGFLVSGRKVSG